jgi:PAS domain S-box-containing protein/putative nucleotidyltransferase with HDIG domain
LTVLGDRKQEDERKKKAQEREEARNRVILSTRFAVRSSWARASVVVGVLVAYALAYLPLRAQAGIAAGLLAILPVGLAGWSLGPRGGLLAGLFVLPLHTLLVNLAGYPGWDVVLRETKGLGPLATIAVGVAVGYWSNLTRTLKQQVAERKQAEAALQESEQRFSVLSAAAFEGIVISDRGQIIDVNEQLAAMLGYERPKMIGLPVEKFVAPESLELVLQHVRSGSEEPYEHLSLRKDGSTFPVEIRAKSLPYRGRIVRVTAIRDIIERKRAEEALRESERRYRLLAENATDVIWTMDMNLRSTYTSPSVKRQRGYEAEEAMAQPLEQALTPASFELVQRALEQELALEMMPEKDPFRSRTLELEVIRKDGSTVWAESTMTFLRDSDGQPIEILGVNRDITERLRAEQALRDSQARLAGIIDFAMDATISLDNDQRIVLFNAAAERMFHCLAAEAMGQPLDRFIPERFREAHREYIQNFGYTNHMSRLIGSLNPLTCRRANGEEFPAEISISQIEMAGEKIYTAMLRDVTERKQAEMEITRLLEESQRRLRQVEALHSIDLAISANMDLRMTLNILLKHVESLLGVDAADILLLVPNSQQFKFSAGRGFRTNSIERTSIYLGTSFAGRAALERNTIVVSGELVARADGEFSKLYEREGFSAYAGVPLIAKGQIKGVLEVYHRSIHRSEPEWLHLLETLAGQAAIAIDNAQLFNDLQQSNLELTLAYDATISGWSRAMDLRDKETEGHTQRVTDLTLKLARAMNISESQLLHIRRGALLHDIGKMGVPDNILLKADQLTDEEWEKMRKHPDFAYEMLSSTRYLQPALDIPYCHHEKWDGSGYPRGLKGEEIPIAARIFAVADVWDAITSDRPYRRGWSKEAALEYIQEQSGKYFDPQVVEEFLEVISSNK